MYFVIVCIALCYRINLLGAVYIVVLVIGFRIKYENALKCIFPLIFHSCYTYTLIGLRPFVTLMAIMILVQYIFLMGLPICMISFSFPFTID